MPTSLEGKSASGPVARLGACGHYALGPPRLSRGQLAEGTGGEYHGPNTASGACGEGMDRRARGRVIVVDDEALIRMGLRVILQDLGYEVVGDARDGQEVAELDSDVVLMVIEMPVMDGLEATRRIMAEHPVPIILLTDYHEQRLVEEAADAGVLAYLVKPVRQAEIGPAIEVARARFAELQWLRRRAGSSGQEASPEDTPRIAQATRLLCERYQMTESEAAGRLRQLARRSRRTLAEIAETILELERG